MQLGLCLWTRVSSQLVLLTLPFLSLGVSICGATPLLRFIHQLGSSNSDSSWAPPVGMGALQPSLLSTPSIQDSWSPKVSVSPSHTHYSGFLQRMTDS